METTERALFEEKVVRSARRFDLKALIELLVSRGYPREQVLFQGNPDGSASSLIEAVEFRERPARSVVITVNLGLLGDNGLLPSYFLRAIERSREPERFYDFIRFFDHRLIENYLRAVWPEDDTAVYGEDGAVARAFLRMSGLSSVSTLQWLGQTYFPELRVYVTRQAFGNASTAHSFRTGDSTLDGTSVIGQTYEVDVLGFALELVAEEEVDDRGNSWATVVRRRMTERFLPVLAPFRIPLLMRLRVQVHASWAHLATTSQRGYLGYDRLQADEESGHTVILFRGVTGSSNAP